jgi:hypothetical protein
MRTGQPQDGAGSKDTCALQNALKLGDVIDDRFLDVLNCKRKPMCLTDPDGGHAVKTSLLQQASKNITVRKKVLEAQ